MTRRLATPIPSERIDREAAGDAGGETDLQPIRVGGATPRLVDETDDRGRDSRERPAPKHDLMGQQRRWAGLPVPAAPLSRGENRTGTESETSGDSPERRAPLIAALLAAVIAAPAAAAPTIPYTPGGSPCAGACSYEWALVESGAPEGQPGPVVVQAGMISRFMSYAKHGQPLVDRRPLELMSDQPGRGYWFRDPRTGERLLIVQLDACANWAVFSASPDRQPIVTPAAVEALAPSPRITPRSVAAYSPAAGAGGGWSGSSYWAGGGCDCATVTPPERPEPPVAPPAPVPAPAAAWLLLAGLAAIGSIGVRS